MAATAADSQLVLDVWPATPPGENRLTAPEKWDQNKPGEPTFRRVTNVSHPTLTVFRPPADKDTGVAVIVCPGGGYVNLMMDYEGEDIAKWFNSIGVTGIVLKYRVPAPQGTPRWLPGLQDAQRSISIIRSKAAEWKLSPDRIGMLGFSAGGHLTAAASAGFEKRVYDAIDDVDKVSCRPDFGVVIYPGGVIDKQTKQLSAETKPNANTPPTFIAQANDDPVNAENSVALYLALKEAGVSAEMHIYSSGGHGFGIRPSTRPSATWIQRCQEWMVDRGILKAK